MSCHFSYNVIVYGVWVDYFITDVTYAMKAMRIDRMRPSAKITGIVQLQTECRRAAAALGRRLNGLLRPWPGEY